MINFRYHVVSLISVFLALAVGIILGAGPLKENIGNELTGQVSALRSEKDALRRQLDQTSSSLEDSSTAIDELAPRILTGTVPDQRVAVVVLSPDLKDEIRGVEARLADGGASVTATVTIDPAWLTREGAADADVREALARSEVGVDGSIGAEDQLAQGLALALTQSAPDGSLTEPARKALAALDDAGLVDYDDPPSRSATSVVVVSGTSATQGDGTAAPGQQNSRFTNERELEVVNRLKDRASTVVGGPRDDTSGIVHAVRQDPNLPNAVSTVTGAETSLGQVTVVLALGTQLGGTVGAYGRGDGATALLPGVPAPTPEATPRPTSTSGSGR